jgi:hypothetical protein
MRDHGAKKGRKRVWKRSGPRRRSITRRVMMPAARGIPRYWKDHRKAVQLLFDARKSSETGTYDQDSDRRMAIL